MPEPVEPIYRREPYDEIAVRDGDQPAVLRVQPLEFPGGRLPSPPPPRVRVRLLDRPDVEYEVSWKDVVQYRPFAELIRNEAEQLVARNQYDDAYRAYAYLHEHHPDSPGLKDSIGNFLLQHARQSFRDNRFEEALSLLLQLKQHRPDDGVTNRALERVIDRLMDRYSTDGRFAAAHAMLGHLRSIFPAGDSETLVKWQTYLRERGNEQLAAAQQHRARERYHESLLACRAALRLWPELPAAQQLADEIRRQYPQVSVAVGQSMGATTQDSIADWSARRGQRLVASYLMQLQGVGADGGIYRSAVGDFLTDETGSAVQIELHRDRNAGPDGQMITGHDVFRQILAGIESPATSRGALLAESLESLTIENVFTLKVALRRPHPRPESLLVFPLDSPSGGQRVAESTGPFRAVESSGAVTRYVRNTVNSAADTSGLRQIVETTFEDRGQVLEALVDSAVDVVDRIYPWELPELPQSSGWNVAEYALPTVHVLIPNGVSERLSRRAMRRAVCYGIDRQAILDQVLSAGKAADGNVAISGPFPVGRSLDDSAGAAADRRIRPRPYEPRLAVVLAAAAAREAAGDESAGVDSGEREPNGAPRSRSGDESSSAGRVEPLVLAHPPDPLAERACQAIEEQLTRIGIQVERKRLAPGTDARSIADYDLLYAELAVWEPLVDVHCLFGERGLVSGVSPYLRLALRDLSGTTRWNDAREQLYRIHRLVHDELPVLPLWQTYNHFAYRTSLRGIAESTVVLYQDVQSWHLAADGEN